MRQDPRRRAILSASPDPGPTLTFALATALAVTTPLALAFLAWAHVTFWRKVLALHGRPDEAHTVTTRDGWRLELRRYRPRGAARFVEPVVLCHGLGTNHLNMDWDPPYGIAQHLAALGRDCFVVSLRGHGGSERPSLANGLSWGFSFDDYRNLDVPAVLDHVLAVTGAPRVQWVGHSMGGMLAYALGGTAHEAKLAGGLVAIGSPASFADQPYLQRLARLGTLIVRGGRIHERYLAGWFAPFTGHFEPPFSEMLIAPKSMEGPVVRRFVAHAVEDIPAGVARQFLDWVHGDVFRSVDRSVDYLENLRAFRAPALLIGGNKDMLAPPGCMVKAHERLASADKTLLLLGADRGSSCDYGHGDLLLGRAAPVEVFPRVAAWLEAHATPV